MAIHNWTIPGYSDQLIYGSTHLPPEGIPPRGVLLMCHGFKGYKDYGFLPCLAEAASQDGWIAHRFNFSHSGMTHETTRFERAELFEQDTWGKQIQDLRSVASAARNGQLPGEAATLPMAWFGHSRGGVTVLLAAWRSSGWGDGEKPAGIVLAAAPHSAYCLGEDQARRLRSRGSIESPSTRTGQVLRIGKGWLEELETQPADFDTAAAIRALDCPVMIIHGERDQTVPASAAKTLSAGLKEGDDAVRMIPDASHTFNAPNPLPLDVEPPAQTQALVLHVRDFLADLA